MHVVIGGFGRVGRSLAHLLETEGHTVAVVDRTRAVFDEYGDDLRGRKLTGEVFDRETLIKAGIEKAGAFAAVTSGDNSNIVAARVARERFHVPVVVARIFDPRRAAIYERFGIPTISAVQFAVGQLFSMIVEPDARTEVSFGGGEVMLVEAVACEKLEGMPLSSFEVPGGVRVTALVRDGIAVLPDPGFEVAVGDKLHVAATRKSLPDLRKILCLGGEEQ